MTYAAVGSVRIPAWKVMGIDGDGIRGVTGGVCRCGGRPTAPVIVVAATRQQDEEGASAHDCAGASEISVFRVHVGVLPFP